VMTGFTNGAENNSGYEVSSIATDTLVAKFVRGAQVTFGTQPAGLDLLINGHDKHLSRNFIVAPGEVFSLDAPAEQTDANGRKWVFKSWTNGGERVQELAIPADAVEKGYRATAVYELLSQVTINTNPGGIPIDVDGSPCDSPCRLDRPDGTEVTVAVPTEHVPNSKLRMEYDSWSDGAPRERTITIQGNDSTTYTAEYTKLYLLEATSSPPDGVDFLMEPASPDRFFPEGSSVRVTAEARDGFSFRRWEGDAYGTNNVATVKMITARSVVAMLDEVPYSHPATILSAVGETPERVVAPGSMITIYGKKLALHPHTGATSPLEQTLLGTTVRIEDRILALMFVSPEQINAVMHPDVPPGDYVAIISRPGELDVEGEVRVVRNAPGLFTYYRDEQFFVVAYHEDGTTITPESPAKKGETISVFGTGFGEYDGIAPYGFPLPESPLYTLVDRVQVLVGDLELEPEFAGGAPYATGMDVVKVKIGDELPAASTMELKIRINERESNTVLLPLE